MATSAAAVNRPKQELSVEQKLQKLRELYDDAPEIGKAALKNGLTMLTEELAAPGRAQTAGRIGARQGKVSELTVFLPFVKGGAKRLRSFLQLLEGNFRAADAVGTVHDMRFVFVDNDTKLLFATAYDGDFDPYIDDFAAKIPNAMDLWLCNCEGYPGMGNPAGGRRGGSKRSARRLTNSSTRSAGKSVDTRRAHPTRRKRRGNANPIRDQAKRRGGRRAEDSNPEGAVRRRAPTGQRRAGEGNAQSQTRAGGGDGDAKCRPYRRPSGQGLGAHRDLPVRDTGGSEAASCLAGVPGGQLQARRRRGHGPRHALRLPGQRHEAALLHRLRWRVGRLHRRLRDEDSRRAGSAVLRCRGVAGDSEPEDQGLDRRAPDRGAGMVRR